MKQGVYNILDVVSNTFSFPFVSFNHDTAKRSFYANMVKNPFAHDMQLYCIGEYDDNIGLVLSAVKPERITIFNSDDMAMYMGFDSKELEENAKKS